MQPLLLRTVTIAFRRRNYGEKQNHIFYPHDCIGSGEEMRNTQEGEKFVNTMICKRMAEHKVMAGDRDPWWCLSVWAGSLIQRDRGFGGKIM